MTYKIKERTTADAKIEANTGDKYMECVADGVIATPSKTAYGEWEFDVYKGADGNVNSVSIMSNVISPRYIFNGYILTLGTGEEINFLMSDGSPNSLMSTTASYIDINTWYRLKVARLKSEGVFKDIETLQVSDIVSTVAPYDTFTSNGRYGYSAIKTTTGAGNQYAGTVDELSIVDTKKYLVEYDLKLNSGTLPSNTLRASMTGSVISNITTASEGRNSIVFTATSIDTGVISFYNATGDTTDYKVSGLTIRRIYDADTFAVFIKGGSFGDIYTLVDTTSGSGTNPVGDSTYTTSEYFVADLDAADKLTNIKITSGVTQ